MYAKQNRIGCVGPKVFQSDGSVKNGGLILQKEIYEAYHGWERESAGVIGRLIYSQDVSAVSDACVMIRKDLFEEMHGFDESYQESFYGVDLCLRIRKQGYWVVMNPLAAITDHDLFREGNREKDEALLKERYAEVFAGYDPYYSPNYQESGNYIYSDQDL